MSLCACSRTSGIVDEAAIARLCAEAPFEMPAPALPQIPDRSVSLADFGGVGDGVTLNTEAFRKAVEALEAKGGGHLDVPAGIWLTGPIELKDHIDLHLDANAIIVLYFIFLAPWC